jgi:hypothetical protein
VIPAGRVARCEWATRLVTGFDAADPARASLQAIVAEWTGDAGLEATQTRVQGGYGGLIAHLARAVPRSVEQRMGSRVHMVDWSTGPVALDVSQGGISSRIGAKVVVVTKVGFFFRDQGHFPTFWTALPSADPIIAARAD